MASISASDSFRLPVFQTLKGIYTFLWSVRRDFVLTTALPVFALTVYHVAAINLLGAVGSTTAGGERLPTFWDIPVLYLPSLLLYTIFAVAWHRRYLLKDEASTAWSALAWDVTKTRFLFRSVLILLIAAALVSVPIVILTIFGVVLNFAAASENTPPVDVATLSSMVIIMASVIFFILYLRLSIWLPATAIEAPISFLELVHLGRYNSWRILAIVFGAEIGPSLLFILLSILANKFPESSTSIGLIIELIQNALAYAVLTAGITALSAVYDRLLARLSNDPLYTQVGMPFINE